MFNADCNRTGEVLRVVEDIPRFRKEDSNPAALLKKETHAISRACDRILRLTLKGLMARDTRVRLSRRYKRSRFRVYDLEERCLPALEAKGAED